MKHRAAVPLLLSISAVAHAQNWRSLEVTDEHRTNDCLIEWQRTLADAEAISRATGRPLLVCVNMDGESASQAFAHRKYKNEDFAQLTRGFVPVIASPNRHNPRDHDEHGWRIPCSRFGVVTCGEHVEIEPKVYAKYFDGKRYAPRHIGVSPDGKKLFDHYLNQDLAIVDDALIRHAPETTIPLEETEVVHRDARVREAAESAFLRSPASQRMAQLRKARAADPTPFEIIRLGLHDARPEVRERAGSVLAATLSGESIELVFDALQSGAAEAAVRPLKKRMTSIASTDASARRALRILEGISHESDVVDPSRWRRALQRVEAKSAVDTPDYDELLAHLEALDAGQLNFSSVGLQLEYARTHLALAKRRIAAGGDPTFFLIDARRAARNARELGAPAHRSEAVLAEAAFLLSEFEAAAEHARHALPRHVDLAAAPESAELLSVFARVRTNAIYLAEDRREDWPANWLADADAAFEALAAHPHATPQQFVQYSQLLAYLGLEQRNGEVLRRGLERFPLSPDLHQLFRAHVWRADGPPALEIAYERLDFAREPAAYAWFRAYATLVYAEHLQRADDLAEARSAYERSIRLFEESVAEEKAYADTADHFIALCEAALAFQAIEAEDWNRAVDLVVKSLARRPASALAMDGLGRSPSLAFERLRAGLERAGEPASDAKTTLEERVREIAPDLVDGSAG